MARIVPVFVAGLVVIGAVSCSWSMTKADGPRKKICGTWIGRATSLIGSGPWYVRAMSSSPPTIHAPAGTRPTWVQVSADCAHGQPVEATKPAVISLIDSVEARDGRMVAVLVLPRQVGSAALTKAGGRTLAIFEVTPPQVAPKTSPAR